jgi:tetratricopeptide (TPR) repeat protein
VSPSAEPEAGTAAWHHGRAETHVRAGRHDEALTEVRAALALAPRHFPSLQLIDWLLVGRRRHQEVIALWTGYLAAVPDDGAAYLERGGTYSQIGDRTRALADFARACELGQSGACDILTRAGVRPPR